MGLQPIVAGHEDLIHDVAFDYYGKTLATCSSDRHIRVFTLHSNTNKWQLRDSWKAHDLSIVKLAFAPPEYGQLLASVSYDRTVKVWEHKPESPSGSGSCYKRLATINDAQGPLFDLSFAPGYLETLRLATVGADGVLRIYEALNISDLLDWQLVQLVPLLPKPANINRPANFTVNWCQSKFAQEKIAVTALDVCIILLRDPKSNKYRKAKSLPDHNSIIRDVAWAPSMGRSYELLATASKDGYVRIYKINDRNVDSFSNSNSNNSLNGAGREAAINEDLEFTDFGRNKNSDELENRLETTLLAKNDDHKSEVWSVSWNSTGTVLSSSGDDGKVRFWKASRLNEYRCIATTSAQQKD